MKRMFHPFTIHSVCSPSPSYPDGPARNPTSVQRGSVQFLSIYPGDPTTPGYPAYENATRTEGTNIPSIPSLPISWANAEKLLSKFDEGGEWEGKSIRLVNKGECGHGMGKCRGLTRVQWTRK